MVRQRLIRDEASLPDEAVLVRGLFERHPDGVVFDRGALVADATRNFELFGYYGLSLWAISGDWSIDRVLADKTRKAVRAAVFTAGALRDKGLGLVPSGSAPHYDTNVGTVNGQTFGSVQVTASSAEDLIDRFMEAAYTVVENHHYQEDLR